MKRKCSLSKANIECWLLLPHLLSSMDRLFANHPLTKMLVIFLADKCKFIFLEQEELTYDVGYFPFTYEY